MQLKSVSGSEESFFKTYANTSNKMGKIINVLLSTDSNSDNGSENVWAEAKTVCNKLSFAGVRDLDISVVMAVLFDTVVRVGCSDLKSKVTNVLKKTAKCTLRESQLHDKDIKSGQDINLGEALSIGDGKCIGDIINGCNSDFKSILCVIFDGEQIKACFNKMKGITPPILQNSKKALAAVGKAFKTMTGTSNSDTNRPPIFFSVLTIENPKDFKNLKDNYTSITISEKIRKIPDSAFYNFKKLREIEISDGVDSIGQWAFQCCSGLRKVVIPDTVCRIGKLAFADCKNLAEIDLPDSSGGFKSIEIGTFMRCEKLKEVVIPNGVTEIGESAFYGCENLKKIEIPNTVTKVGADAFKKCDSQMTIKGNADEEIKDKIRDQID